MSPYFVVHPVNPQTRLISQAVGILRQGGVIVYPTDSGYALGCMMVIRVRWKKSVAFVSWKMSIILRCCVMISRSCRCMPKLITLHSD